MFKFLIIIIKKELINFLKNKNKLLYNLFLFLWLINFIAFAYIKKNLTEKHKKYKYYRLTGINFIIIFLFTLFLKIKNLQIILSNVFIKIGNDRFNFWSLFISLVWIIIAILSTSYNKKIYEFVIDDIEKIDLSYKFLLFKFICFVLFYFILFFGFNFMKLNIFFLSITGGAISLGLSISLQKLISNYVSGIIILWEKSFKIGDAVNINGYQGMITQINSRNIVLRNLDCSEISIPNEKFLNDIVQNQSIHFSKGNLRVSVQISYNNDVDLVLKLLLDSTKEVERVLDNPLPISYFNNFDINGIDLELSFWIYDAVRGAALVKSEVNINILKEFRKHDIELSYKRNIVKLL